MENNMKANELMIGDWVSDKYGYLTQITFIGNGYVSFEDDEGNLCQLDDKCNQPEPIPLTPEILKKNGWYWGLTSEEEDMVSLFEGAYDEHWVYDEGAGEISLIFPEDTNGGLLKVDDQRFNRHLNFLWNDTLYVHELQNSLRICGLNELADNFKL